MAVRRARHSRSVDRHWYRRAIALAVILGITGVVVVVVSIPRTSIAGTSLPQRHRHHPVTTTTTTVPLNQRRPVGPPAVDRHLVLDKVIGGDISPKSVVSTNDGLVFAQNMMYRHTLTVYTSAGVLKRTIGDGVVLSTFGVTGRPGLTHGAPVEAAVTPDGRDVWGVELFDVRDRLRA